MLPAKDFKEPLCGVGRCFHHPWVSVPNCREESSIWRNFSPGASSEGQGYPRAAECNESPEGSLCGFYYAVLQCLQTPELHNKMLEEGKRQQQPRLSQLRHLTVPISCKREDPSLSPFLKTLPPLILRPRGIHHHGCSHTSTKPSLTLTVAAEPMSPEGPLITILDRE